MNIQFKRDAFEHWKLKHFADDIIQAGIPAKVTWKRGIKVSDESDTKANNFRLETNGKYFFRQTKNRGIVRLKYLNETEKSVFLGLVKKYGFYTTPNWWLGISLLVVYAIVECFIILTREESWQQILFLSGSFLVLQSLLVAYLHTIGKASKHLCSICLVLGLIGYMSTALWSILALPLYININQNALLKEIEALPAES
ncbi:MAG: hypothetical protein ABI237_08380 [Ginsengibacter sp.]